MSSKGSARELEHPLSHYGGGVQKSVKISPQRLLRHVKTSMSFWNFLGDRSIDSLGTRVLRDLSY